MRNPNRTTKRERRAVRQYNPYAARILGVAQAARWHREGILLDEARGLDNLVNDALYGLPPDDLFDKMLARVKAQCPTHTGYEVSAGLNPHINLKYPPHIILGTTPGALTPTSSNVNNYSAHEPRFTIMTSLETDDIIEVHQLQPGEWQATVDATRRAPASLTLPESLGGGTIEVEHDGADVEPLGPSACGHYEVVEMTASADYFVVPYLSEPRPQVVPESWVTVEGADGGAWFAKYRAYREGRELGDAYLVWDGDPWRDPGEVADVHAEAIENALNDDIDPGE